MEVSQGFFIDLLLPLKGKLGQDGGLEKEDTSVTDIDGKIAEVEEYQYYLK